MFLVNHLYLLAALYFLFFWIIFFTMNPKGRKFMFVVSIFGMLLGPFVQEMHLIDWWYPNFWFDTFIKIEDLIFGFGFAGVASSVFSILAPYFNTRDFIISNKYFFSILSISTVLLFGLFYWLGISSFWSSVIACLFGIAGSLYKKPFYFIPSLLTGIFMIILVLPGYLGGFIMNPTWFQDEWFLEKLSSVFFLNIPIEELIWFFLATLLLALLQGLWGNKKFLFKYFKSKITVF